METVEQIQLTRRINSIISQSCQFFDHRISMKLLGIYLEEWEENKIDTFKKVYIVEQQYYSMSND